MKTNKIEQFNITNEDGSISTYTADQVFANLFVSFNVSNGEVDGTANLRLTPYAQKDDGTFISSNLPERIFIKSGLFKTKDRQLQVCVLKIHNAIQELILAKNL